jgi:hypothetical protein
MAECWGYLLTNDRKHQSGEIVADQDPKQRLFTMREAATLLDMGTGTLLKWIMAGIFRPVIHSRGSVGPGKGSKLNFADLVTAATLGSMLASGLRYEHLQLGRRTTIPVDIRLQNHQRESGFEIVKSLEGRTIQEYLEGLNYEAIVVMDFELYWGTGPVILIWFAPEESANWFFQRTGDRYSVPSEKTTFIYCRFWKEFVLHRLKVLV